MKILHNYGDTFGSAVIQAIREQAAKKNFKFESKVKSEEKAEAPVSK